MTNLPGRGNDPALILSPRYSVGDIITIDGRTYEVLQVLLNAGQYQLKCTSDPEVFVKLWEMLYVDGEGLEF